jgi:hypothetical protein
MNSTWRSLCLPAKVYPVGMAALLLFDLYRGHGTSFFKNIFALVIGTGLLYVLCVNGMESVAWILLGLPFFFFIALLALLLLDLSMIDVTHTFQQACGVGTHRMTKAEESCSSC